MTAAAPARDLRKALIGRTFMHPVLDYLLIGSVISIAFTAYVVVKPELYQNADFTVMMIVILLANSAHFSSSTVRLYTIPGASQTWPMLTLVFPLLALGALTVCLVDSDLLGPQLQALYLSWSPFHFARQGYGLSVMYSYRSGCILSERDKQLLHQAALLPFYYVIIMAGDAGIDWLLPTAVLRSWPIQALRDVTEVVGRPLAVIAPFLVFAKVWRSPSGPMPIIALLCVLTTTMWFVILDPLNAFVWATIFHGIQYLAIIMVFHVKERVAEPDNRHSGLYHALWFYGATLVLGYLLFHALPAAFVWAGMGFVQSKVAVIAGINIHHFIVDGFIWKFKAGGANRKVVDEEIPAPA